MSIGNLSWRWPWLPVLALFLALAFGLLASRAARRRKLDQERGARIWTLDSDLDTEEGHESLRRWRRLNRCAAILLALALLMVLSLAARPARVDRTLEQGHNRDIVLCLDVSGSTLPYDRQVIGDGLVGCAALLPQFAPKGQPGPAKADQRSSSLVLATDNVVSGKPTYTLEEALKLTSAAGIAVDGLYSGPDQGTEAESTRQMQRLIEARGGIFLRRQDGNSINALVRRIEHRHGADPRQQEQSSLVDAPGWWTLALALALSGYLLLAWRLKR